MSKCKVLIVTAAPPGTEDSFHHVNCKNTTYWIYNFAKYGFKFDEAATTKMRTTSSMTREFMRSTGMVLIKEEGYSTKDLPDWMQIENELNTSVFTEEEKEGNSQIIDNPDFTKNTDGWEVKSSEINDETPIESLAEVFEKRVEEKLDGADHEDIFIINEMTEDQLNVGIKKCIDNIKDLTALPIDMSAEIKLVEEMKLSMEDELKLRMSKAVIDLKYDTETNTIKDSSGEVSTTYSKYHPFTNEKLQGNTRSIKEGDAYYLITITKAGKERKGSRKLVGELVKNNEKEI